MTDQPKPDPLYQLELTEAETEAERVIAEETERERQLFAPHIHADFCFVGPCRKRPDESFSGGSSTPNILIPPEISKLPCPQQLPLLKPLIQEHFARYGTLVTEYGERIDGYRAWLSLEDWDECEFYLFDTDGKHIPDEPSPWPKPHQRGVKSSNRGRRSKRTNTNARRN